MPSIKTNQQTGQAAIESGALVRAPAPAVNVAPPTPPLTKTNELNPVLRTPLPPSYTQQPDQQRQWQMWGVTPQARVAPLPPSANAQVGASAASQAAVAIAATPSTGTGGGVTSVGLALPKEFVVTGSPVTSTGTLTGAWATEPASTFFKTAGPGLGGFQALGQSSLTVASGTGTLTTTATPTTSSTFGLFFAVGNNNFPAIGGGWTAIMNTGDFVVAYNSFSGTSPVSLSFSGLGLGSYLGAMTIFQGPLPTVVQSKNGGGAGSGTVAFTSNNTAGNVLVVACQGFNFDSNGFGVSVSDSNGNSYQQISNQYYGVVGANPELTQLVFVATNCAAGANTVTFNFNGKAVVTSNVTIIELGPLPAGASIPFFAPFNATDIPQINLGSSGPGGVGGVLRVANGGTGVTNSTGTGNTVLSASPTFTGTVALPACNFTGVLNLNSGSTIGTYNNISTVANGVPSEYAAVNRTAQVANVAATTAYAIPASGAGLYRVSVYLVVSQAASVSSTLPDSRLIYTDRDSGATITVALTTSDSGNTTSIFKQATFVLNGKASTNIQYDIGQVTPYASSGGTPMQFAYRSVVEYLG